MSRRCAAALMAALLLLAPATSALAATCPRTSLPDVEDEVMCLVCGVPLALADAPQAQRERVFIARMVRQCRSKEEIESALVAAFPVAGLGLAAARRRRQRRASLGGELVRAPALDPLQAARIDAELDRYR